MLVTLEVVPGVPHVFQAYAATLDEGAAALATGPPVFLNANFHATEPTVAL